MNRRDEIEQGEWEKGEDVLRKRESLLGLTTNRVPY